MKLFLGVFKNAKTRYTVIVIGLCAIFAVYWNFGRSVANVASYDVTASEFIIDLNEAGETKAHSSMTVSTPRLRGQLQITKLAEEGSIVKKGDFLVQFDTAEFARKLEEEKNKLIEAQAELDSKQAQQKSKMAQLVSSFKTQEYSHRLSQLNLEKMKYEASAKQEEAKLNMKKADIALEQAKESIETQKVIDAAELQQAKIKIRQAEIELEKAEKQLNDATLSAPGPGLVVYEKIWGGSGMAKVKVGDTPWRGQGILSIPDLSKMQVKTAINEVDVSKIREGQEVIVHLDAHAEDTYYGTVTEIANLARTEKGEDNSAKVFDVTISIKEADAKVKPGMSASCQIIIDRIDSVLSIPLQSVFEKEDTTVCYVFDPNPKMLKIEVGPKNKNYIVVKKGLKAGDQITLWDPTEKIQNIGSELKEPTKAKSKKNGSNNMFIIGG